MAEIEELFQSVLNSFPKIQFGFGYGSGVFEQKGYSDKSKPMVDFIFVVDDPLSWHAENLNRNWHHYSFLKYFGPSCITKIEEGYGAGLYYNTLVPFEDRKIKYGVISKSFFEKDLGSWTHLYAAGRTHKPISPLFSEPEYESTLAANRLQAVRTSLLLLPSTFSLEKLYSRIAALSFTGDFRVGLAENPNKVSNIVSKQRDHFDQIYLPLLEQLQGASLNLGSRLIEQDDSPDAQLETLNQLPSHFRAQIIRRFLNYHPRYKPCDDGTILSKIVAKQGRPRRAVVGALISIVALSSRQQAVKGFLSAGPVKSAEYALSKLLKRWMP